MGESDGALPGGPAKAWAFLRGEARGASAFVGAVFVAALGSTLWLAWTHAPIVPYLDDCGHVTRVAGEEKITADWLWSQHNEHRIPLPKLLSQAFARLSGMDGRPESAINVLFLAAAALLLLGALRRFRGRLLWTDACVPLILLSWAQWENLAWPFQIAFTLYVFLVSAGLAMMMARSTGPPFRARPFLLGSILLALPLCGAPGLPLALALAGGWLLCGAREGEGGRWVRFALPMQALALIGLYFLGLDRPAESPPPPGAAGFVSVTVQALAAPLGHAAQTTWPVSGIVVLALLAMAVVVLVEAAWNRPAVRRPAVAALAVLGGVVLLAASIGYGRGGGWYGTGFTSRYATLTSLAFVGIYAAAEFAADVRIAGALRTGMLALTAAVALPNAMRAVTELAPRREAGERMMQDILRGVPLPLLTERYITRWHYRRDPSFDPAMEALARGRLAVFRRLPPPPRTILDEAYAGGGRVVELPDGRFALAMPPDRVRLPLPEGRAEVTLTIGSPGGPAGESELSAYLEGSSEPSRLVRTETFRWPGPERQVAFLVDNPGGRHLRLEAASAVTPSGVSFWVIPEIRAPSP